MKVPRDGPPGWQAWHIAAPSDKAIYKTIDAGELEATMAAFGEVERFCAPPAR